MQKLTLLLLCVLMMACASAHESSDALYQALGGKSGVDKLATNLLVNIARDERIADLFRDAKIDRLHDKLAEQFCALSGGPCIYTGDSMAQSHAGMHITDAQFNALVEDLIKAMEMQGIGVGAQNRLLALLAPMHSDIVYH